MGPQSTRTRPLIRVPDWVQAPLDSYDRYFAHHQGRHIRLAYAAHVPVCQLRVPALFEDAARSYLLYAVAGEQGIAIARIYCNQ